MRKLVNKKGQGLSTTTLVLLILAGIILVVVALGFTQGWGYIFDKINLLPGDLEAAAQSCGISATQGLSTSYCNEFKELKIAGKNQWANCDYLEGYAEFTKLTTDCSAEIVTKLESQVCTNEGLDSDDLVNGNPCPNPITG